MLTRRDFLQVAAAAAVLTGGAPLARAAARQAITQDQLLAFKPVGQVTLLNFTDIHAQLRPLYFREPSVNVGIGAVKGLPPHLTGKDFLKKFGLKAGSAEAYALTSEDFSALSKTYGRIGGLDRMATLVKAVRAQRPGNTLLVDCGDTWQGSYTSLMSKGEDMVDSMNLLGVDVMVPHWEFTYGEARVKELIAKLNFPFLAQNVKDTEWEEDVFPHTAMFERGGVKVAVIGQAFPYTPVANPRYMIPKWSFGIRDDEMQKKVDAAKAAGAELIVVASHNGFDVDRKMATRVTGIDVLLTGHTHDAIPAVIKVGDTLMVASGSHGKFLARLDVEVKNKKVTNFAFKLMPIFSDAIAADADMAAMIEKIRAPHKAVLERKLARTETLLYRRGNVNGSFDDLICQALLDERDAQIALSPGFRWGSSLPPGSDITVEDVFNQTAITYPNAYRSEMAGQMIKDILEDVADNLYNPDPYYQQGGDMVRVGGLGYRLDVAKPIGSRVTDMVLLKSGEKVEAAKTYTVTGWASVNEGTQGPPVWDVVNSWLEKKKVVSFGDNQAVKVVGG
jgi:sulfur-oxidizing protein SoxB